MIIIQHSNHYLTVINVIVIIITLTIFKGGTSWINVAQGYYQCIVMSGSGNRIIVADIFIGGRGYGGGYIWTSTNG